MLQDSAQSVADMLNYGWCLLERRKDPITKAPDYAIIEANKVFRDLTGMESVSGQRIETALPAAYTEIRLGLEEVRTAESVFISEIAVNRHRFEVHASRFGRFNEQRYALLINEITWEKKAIRRNPMVSERLVPTLDIGLAGSFYWDIRQDCVNLDENIAHYLSLPWEVLTHGLPLRKVLPAITDEDRVDVYRSLMRAIRDSDVFQAEFRIRVPKGGIRWVSARAAVKRDKGGLPIELSGFAMDISERKQTEQVLQEREEQLRLALNISGMGTMVWDIKNNKVELDKRISTLWGLATDGSDFSFESVTAAVHVDDRKGLSQAIEAAMTPKDGGVFTIDIRTVHPDGSEHWLALVGKATFHDKRRRQPRMIILATDITERKRNVRQLAFLGAIQSEFARPSSAEEIMEAVGDQIGSFFNIPLFFAVEEDEHREKKRILYPWCVADGLGEPVTARLPELLTGDFCLSFQSTDPIVIQDTERDTSTKSATFRDIGIRSMMCVPFHRHNGWKSALVICDLRARQWRDDEIDALRQLAEKVFPFLERAHDQEALRESETRLEMELETMHQLYQSGTRLMGVMDLHKALQEVLDSAIRLLGADFGNFQLYDPDKDKLELVVHRGFDKKFVDTFYFVGCDDNTACGRAIKLAKRVIIEDVMDDELFGPYRSAAEDAGFRAVQSTPLFDGKGNLLGVLSTHFRRPHRPSAAQLLKLDLYARLIVDFIARMRTEAALAKSEESYRAIVNQSVAGILKMDFEGHVVFSNERFATMLGYELSEMASLTVANTVHPDDKDRNMALFNLLVNEGKSYDIEKRLQRKDGSYIWVNNQVSPLFDDQGIPQSAVVVSVDITKQKAVERLKDEFIAIASHELRTPLTTIKAYGQLIENSLEQHKIAMIGELTAKLNSQITRMTKLVYSLLDSALVSGGKLILKPETFDMNALVEECIEGFRSHSGKLTHELQFKPCNLPLVTADRRRIGQVLANLISNAMKYSQGGSHIIVICERDDALCRVSVVDKGIGIDPEHRENIFERFFRVTDPSVTPISGFGLGLYIAAEIIRQHHGTIGFDSVPGHGSLFYFEIPVSTPMAQ